MKKLPSQPFRVLFFGNDDFSLASLRALRFAKSPLIKKLDVVSNKSSRPSPVRLFALNNGLPISDWPLEIEQNSYDVGIVVSFGHLIPKRTIEAFPRGMINVHGSLLPKWRGSSPIAHSILHGDEHTGVTIMQIKPKNFDTGDILMQESCAIPRDINTPVLTDIMAEMGSSLLITCLENLDHYVKNSIKQDPKLVTSAPKLTLEMGEINWSEATIEKLDHQYRALSHAVPIYTFWRGTKIKFLSMKHIHDIHSSAVKSIPENVQPGYMFYHKRRKLLCVKCIDGWIGICSLMVSGKKTMSAADFYNGFLSKCDATEWQCD